MSEAIKSPRIVNKGRRSLCGWVEILDEKTQKFYYHDPSTGKVSWKHPKQMGIFPKDETQVKVEAKKEEIVNEEPKKLEKIMSMPVLYPRNFKIAPPKEDDPIKSPRKEQISPRITEETIVSPRIEEKKLSLSSIFSTSFKTQKKEPLAVPQLNFTGNPSQNPKESPRLNLNTLEKNSFLSPRTGEIEFLSPRLEETFQRKFDEKNPDDLILLREPSDVKIREVLNERYKDGNFYTYVGPQLVSVNPYEDKRIYSNDIKHLYHTRNPYELSPHLYTIAELAYQKMKESGKPQTIIISGDSGSGKTIASRLIVDYISKISISGSVTDYIAKIMTNSNPILEAFGNAKTLKNNNSSRYGKNTELYFNFKGQLEGGDIVTSLLEKSRVCYQRKGERNFHIFYQLCAADEDVKNGLGITSAKHFNYLNHNEITVEGINDQQSFKETCESLAEAGIQPNEQMEIYKITAGILHLGNIRFTRNVQDKTEKGIITTRDVLKLAAKNFGVSESILEEAILNRKIKIGKNEVNIIAQNEVQAAKNRDALAKDIYERLFKWLIHRINISAKKTDEAKYSIGILDIYGFEIYKDKENSFEQLNINFFNEKVQQLVQKWLVKELDEYITEGVAPPNSNIKVKSSIECIELIEGTPVGVYALLNEQSLLKGGGSDKNFVAQLNSNFDKEKYKNVYTKDQFEPLMWHCNHYAAKVPYYCDGWIAKNNDTVYEDLILSMRSTNSQLVQSLYPKSEILPSESKLQNTSVKQFKDDVSLLVSRVNGKEQHYIRCINPNLEKKPKEFHSDIVEDQVKYLGITENVLIKKSGYFTNIDYGKFLSRYKVCSKDTFPRWKGDPKEGVKKILEENEITKHAAFGETKIFLKTPFIVSILEEKIDQKKDDMAKIIQNSYERYKKKKKRKEELYLLKSIIRDYKDKSELLFKGILNLVLANGEREKVMLLLTENSGYLLDESNNYSIKKKLDYENMKSLFCSNYNDGIFGIQMIDQHDVILESENKHDIMEEIIKAYKNYFKGNQTISKRIGDAFQYKSMEGVTMELKYKQNTKKMKIEPSKEGLTVNVNENLDVYEGKKIRRRASFNRKYYGDYLHLQNGLLMKSLKEKNGDTKVLFSSSITKYNKRYKDQERVLLITDKHIYNLEPNGYLVNRMESLSKVKGVSLSPYTDGFFIVHMEKGDYVYESNKKTEALKMLSDVYIEFNHRTLKFYVNKIIKNIKKSKEEDKIEFLLDGKDNTYLEPVKGGAKVHIKQETIMNINIAGEMLQDIYKGQKLRRRNSLVRWYLGDYLHIQNSKMMKPFEKNNENKILFSGMVSKINKRYQVQNRKMIITEKSIYNIDNESFDIKRRIPIEKLESIHCSQMKDGFFIFRVPDEYDYLQMSSEKTEIFKILMDQYKILTGKELPLYIDNNIIYHPEERTLGGRTVQFKENLNILVPQIYKTPTGIEIHINNNETLKDSKLFEAGIQDKPESVYSGRKYRRRASISREYLGDYLRMEQKNELKSLMLKNGDKKLIFSGEVNKINRMLKPQKRILIITDDAVYNIDPKDFKVKRRIPFREIQGASVSSMVDNYFCLHTPNSYDYLYESDKKTEILNIIDELLKSQNKLLPINVTDKFQYQPQHGQIVDINFVLDDSVSNTFLESSSGMGLSVHVHHQEPLIILEGAFIHVKDQPKPIEVGSNLSFIKLRKRWKYKLEIRFYCNGDIDGCKFYEKISTVTQNTEYASIVGKLVKRDERYVITLPEREVMGSLLSKTEVICELRDAKDNLLLIFLQMIKILFNKNKQLFQIQKYFLNGKFLQKRFYNQQENKINSEDDIILEDVIRKVYKEQKKDKHIEKDIQLLENSRIRTIKEWNKLTEEQKEKEFPLDLRLVLDEAKENVISKLSVEKIISIFSSNSLNEQTKEVEEFLFPYQKRSVSEELFVQKVCSNFISHYKKSELHQKWSIITIIGGSGTGKSRFSYETWNIL